MQKVIINYNVTLNKFISQGVGNADTRTARETLVLLSIYMSAEIREVSEVKDVHKDVLRG